MCGIVGFVNYKQDISKFRNVLNKMNSSLSNRGPDEQGFYIRKQVAFAHKRLVVVDPIGGKQPMIENFSDSEYSIVYNGQIYNTKELRDILIENGFSFSGHSDTEVLLKAFIFYGPSVVNHLNGIFAFAIWNSKSEELFIARDHFGVKPLFYTMQNNSFIFASEIKAIFQYPGVAKIVNGQGISELFGIGPAHTPGLTVFDNIFELKPAHYAVFNKSGLHIHRYWKLTSQPHTESFDVTCQHLEYLLKDSITRQLVSDVPLCTFLSGGLDSSIITKFASDYCNENGLEPLNTFSIDYVDNDKNFVKSDFQPNSDNYYINLMVNKLNTVHHPIVIDTPELADYLEDAMIARDMPGMADIDSSLLLFCKYVKPNATVALTGECADEIFGGYPWFYRKELMELDGFPWSSDIAFRATLLREDILTAKELSEYAKEHYLDSVRNAPHLADETPEEHRRYEIAYLNIKWFMQTLLDRMDRTSMYSGLEARVPFADHRIIEYVYNVPWKMKYQNGTEKALLRDACADLLPEEILHRKKSPYPKTYSPVYEKMLTEKMRSIVQDPNSPVLSILDTTKLETFLKEPAQYGKPWFGQLMAGPQLLAYYIQLNYWMEKYHLSL